METYYQTYKDQFEKFEEILTSQVKFFSPDLADFFKYCFQNKGKRLRPLLIFLCANHEHKDFHKVISVAVAIELIHLASLVHDDILDHANIRHAMLTVYRKFGSKTAVLLGDALFSQAFQLIADLEDSELSSQLAVAVHRTVEGELRQNFYSSNEKMPKLEDYFEILGMKTGALFSFSCYAGAKLSKQSIKEIQNIQLFGQHFGIAYQLMDDLVDYNGTEAEAQKTLGTDYFEGKWTLPLLLFYERCSDAQKKLVQKRTKKNFELLKSEMTNLNIFSESNFVLKHQIQITKEHLSCLNSDQSAQLNLFVSKILKKN